MLVYRLEENDGVVIGDSPDTGVAIKVLARSGRRVSLAINTAMRVSKEHFGISPPGFRPGLAGAVAMSSASLSCAAS